MEGNFSNLPYAGDGNGPILHLCKPNECYSLQSYEFALTTQNLQNFLGYLTKDWRGVLSDLGL